MKNLCPKLIIAATFCLCLIAGAAKAQKEELRLEILNGHSGGGVLAVAVSQDGKFALTGSTDQTALLWDLETGKQLRRFFGYHEDAVSCVQFSKDGQFVLTASYDSSAQLWETATGRRVHGFGENRGGVLIKHSGRILSCAISADMKMVATAGEDKTARIWDFETGKQLFELRHAGRVNSIAFSPDSRYLLTGGEDKIARLFSTETGKEERQFVGHTGEIRSVAYSPDGNRVLTGSGDSTARLWDSKTTAQIREFTPITASPVHSVAFTTSGKKIFALYKLYDAETGKEIGAYRNTGWAVAITPDERRLLSAYTDDLGYLWKIFGLCDFQKPFMKRPTYVSVYDVEKMEVIKTLDGQSGVVNDLAVTPNLHVMFTAAADNTSGLWNIEKGQGFKLTEYNQEIVEIRSAAFSNDGKWLVSEENNSLILRDGSDGKILRERHDVLCWGRDVAISPDSRFILGKYNNSTIVMLNAETLNAVWSFSLDWKKVINEDSNDNFIRTFVLSRDGKKIAIAGDSKIGVWNIETGEATKPLIIIKGIERVQAIAFSPDGKTIATASGGEIDMQKVGIGNAAKANGVQSFDVETGKEIDSFGGEFKILSNKITGFKPVAYSPDGKYLAAGSFDGKVYLRNNESKEIKKFEGHTDTVNSVKFAKDADGKLLVVSGSSDSTTRIWNAATGEEICALVTFRDGNWAVVQTRTGRYDAPNGGEIDGIQWVFGNEIIELKQLGAMYYTPNLLPRLLGYNKDPLPSVVPLRDVKLYPEVVEQKFDAQSGKLNVKLRARNGGIGKTEVYVRGKITDQTGGVTEAEKLVVRDARDERLKKNPNVPAGEIVSLSVELPPDSFVKGSENQIKVVTSNFLKEIGKENIQSRGTEIVYRDSRKEELRLPNLYAIVGGVSDYAGDGLDLRFAAKDAEDFSNALQLGARRLFGVDKVQIRTLSTQRQDPQEQPTKENFRRAVEEIAQKAKPEDIFLIYLAGHGVTLGTGTDTYFYLTKEARSTSKTDLESNFQSVAISNAELIDWLTPNKERADDIYIKALKQVVILDTCAAGNFAAEDWKKDREGLTGDQIRAMEFLKNKTGTFILMGAAANAVSYEANSYNQGLLTYSLLEGMKGFALQKPTENVDVRLLFDYAEKRVENLAKNLGLEQRPLVKQPSGSTFVIGQMSDAEKQKIELAKEKPLVLRPNLGMLPRNNDPLGLTAQLRKALDAESSYSVVRQRGEREPSLIYIDDDNLPNAVQVTGTYTTEGEQVKVKAYLFKGDKEIAALEINEPKTEVINKMLMLIRAELTKVK